VLVDIGSLRRADAGHDPRGMHSLHYTAPEVLADPRSPREPASDLYALGAVAFFCFTGKDPPVASSPGYLGHARAELDAALRDVRRRTRRRVRDHVLRLLDPDPRRGRWSGRCRGRARSSSSSAGAGATAGWRCSRAR
jgi:serine/threonine protein kinase